MSQVWAILVAGGTGTRYGAKQNKLLETLGGETILLRSARQLTRHPKISGLVVVSHPEWKKTYQDLLVPLARQTEIRWANGGETRRDSVHHGLSLLPENCEVVLIHDAARPLVQIDKIEAALAPVLTGEAKGSSLGVPSRNTLKQVMSGDMPWVSGTLDRSTLWQVHTPQVFLTEVLKTAHTTIPHDAGINDDCELVERLYPGEQAVLMVEDEAGNLKITTPGDLTMAKAYLEAVTAGAGA